MTHHTGTSPAQRSWRDAGLTPTRTLRVTVEDYFAVLSDDDAYGLGEADFKSRQHPDRPRRQRHTRQPRARVTRNIWQYGTTYGYRFQHDNRDYADQGFPSAQAAADAMNALIEREGLVRPKARVA